MGKFLQKTLMIFHCFSDFWIKIPKMMWPKVDLGLTLNIFRFYLGASLTVLNPDFTRVIQKSVLSSFNFPFFSTSVYSECIKQFVLSILASSPCTLNVLSSCLLSVLAHFPSIQNLLSCLYFLFLHLILVLGMYRSVILLLSLSRPSLHVL